MSQSQRWFHALPVLLSLVCGTLLLLAPGEAAAQINPPCALCEPGSNPPPTITITPVGGTYASAQLLVEVHFASHGELGAGENELVGDSLRLTLNGVPVRHAFNYVHSGSSGYASGVVNLVQGGNAFVARICDISGQCIARSASYTYTIPNEAPTVSIQPMEGSYRDPSLVVQVSWSDDAPLGESTRTVTLNGTILEETGFTSSDPIGSHSATWTRTVTLSPELNELRARICDAQGACSERSAFYEHTPNQAPTASVQPSGGTFTSASLPVQVNWADDAQLDTASRELIHNGTVVTGSFSFVGTATSATSVGTLTLTSDANTFIARIRDGDGEWSQTGVVSYT
jgi:hypothetical protein